MLKKVESGHPRPLFMRSFVPAEHQLLIKDVLSGIRSGYDFEHAFFGNLAIRRRFTPLFVFENGDVVESGGTPWNSRKPGTLLARSLYWHVERNLMRICNLDPDGPVRIDVAMFPAGRESEFDRSIDGYFVLHGRTKVTFDLTINPLYSYTRADVLINRDVLLWDGGFEWYALEIVDKFKKRIKEQLHSRPAA